jgi:hypothetical protein
MAEERQKPTQNFGRVLMGVTNDASLEPRMLRVDPSTNRLLVDASVSVDINYEYAEDSAHASGNTGAFVLAVRNDAGGAFGADGDYVPFSIDANGALRVTGGGGGTEYTEDVASPGDPVGTTLMMTRDDALSNVTEAEGDWSRIRGNVRGALWTVIDQTTPMEVVQDTAGDLNMVAFGYDGVTQRALATDNAGNLQIDILTLPGDVEADIDQIRDQIDLIVPDIEEIRVDADAIRVAAEIMDDWDETDRAKVNIIAGQAGVTAGAGSVAANTPRVTHASDDPVTTSVQLIDDAIVTDDAGFTPATTKVMMAGFEFDDTSPDSVNEGDGGAARMSANRNIYTTIRDAAGNERGLNIDANGALASVASGAGADGSGVSGNPVRVAGSDGTNTRSLLTDTSGRILIGQSTGSIGKAEDAGHVSGDTGVFALGVRVDNPNTALTNTDADYSPIATNKLGSIRTALQEDDFAVAGSKHVKKYYTNSGAVTDGIVWSPAASTRWYVTDIFINVSAAATVTLEDDLVAGDAAVWKAELAANSGWSHHFGTPLFSGEDAADLLITTSAGNVYVTVTGYEI